MKTLSLFKYKKLGQTELIIYGFTLPEFASSMACLMVLA